MRVVSFASIYLKSLVATSCALALTLAPAYAQSSKKQVREKPTACHLLTNADVAASIGRPVLRSRDMAFGTDMANCTYYSDAAGVIPVASIQINMKGGVNLYKAACESMPKSLGKDRPLVGGLGDQACVDTTPAGSGFFVRKDDKFVTVSTGVVVGKANYDQTLALAKAVAAKF